MRYPCGRCADHHPARPCHAPQYVCMGHSVYQRGAASKAEGDQAQLPYCEGLEVSRQPQLVLRGRGNCSPSPPLRTC